MDETAAMRALARDARIYASSWEFDGTGSPENVERMRRSTRILKHSEDWLVSVTFSRDVGMHSRGWWKNPDYDRCEHLSLAFADRRTLQKAPQQHDIAQVICKAFFRECVRLLWIEPPWSAKGIEGDVHHYRLFMHTDWKTPLLPRGEVYTRDFTEAGWKSFSELRENKEFP